MEYGNVLFAGSSNNDLNKFNKIEKEAMRISTGATAKCNSELLKTECKWESLENRRKNHVLCML